MTGVQTCALPIWGSLFTTFNYGEILSGGFLSLGLDLTDYIIILAGVVLIFALTKLNDKYGLREVLVGKTALSWTLSLALLLVIILFGAYGIGYDASQFIYNQF